MNLLFSFLGLLLVLVLVLVHRRHHGLAARSAPLFFLASLLLSADTSAQVTSPNGTTYVPGGGGGVTVTGGAPTVGHCVAFSGATSITDSGGGCGGSPNFSTIGTGTNTTATMTVSTGALLTTSGTGAINTTTPSTNSAAGAASAAALTFSGAPYSAGTGTTNFPQIYENTTGATAPTTFSTGGTYQGINSASGFAGNYYDFYANGSKIASFDYLNTWGLEGYFGGVGAAEAQIHTLDNQLGTKNYIAIGAGSYNIGSPSGTAACPGYLFSIASAPAGSYYYNTSMYIGGAGDFFVCGGNAAPVDGFLMQDNTVNNSELFEILNSAGHGPQWYVRTDASTTCPGLGSGLSFSGPCVVFMNDALSTGNVLPYFIESRFGSLHAVYGVLANEIIERVGDTTPTTFLLATSTGTSQATVTLGDTNASSATTVTGGTTGGITIGAASVPVTFAGVTGTTQCLQVNSSGLLAGTGSACGSGGSTAFSSITTGSNTTATMTVGSGASIITSGTGIVTATSTNGYATASLPTCNSGAKGQVAYTTDNTPAFAFCNGTSWVSGGGTTFTMAGTGCTPTGATGGATTGKFTLASGPCTVVTITFNGAVGMTATNGWHCDVGDDTAQNAGTWIPHWGQSSSTTTTAAIPIPAAAGTTDVISFNCSQY